MNYNILNLWLFSFMSLGFLVTATILFQTYTVQCTVAIHFSFNRFCVNVNDDLTQKSICILCLRPPLPIFLWFLICYRPSSNTINKGTVLRYFRPWAIYVLSRRKRFWKFFFSVKIFAKNVACSCWLRRHQWSIF